MNNLVTDDIIFQKGKNPVNFLMKIKNTLLLMYTVVAFLSNLAHMKTEKNTLHVYVVWSWVLG